MLYVCVNDDTGQDLVITIDRPSDGYVWNPITPAFEESPSFADTAIPITEGTGEYTRRYTANVSGITPGGRVRINVHPADGSQCLFSQDIDVKSGAEVTLRNVKLANDGMVAISIDGRTFNEAMQIIAAMLAGKVAGARSGEETYYGLDGTTARVIVTVPTPGNRTAVSYP